jgi:hypothetical protein
MMKRKIVLKKEKKRKEQGFIRVKIQVTCCGAGLLDNRMMACGGR